MSEAPDGAPAGAGESPAEEDGGLISEIAGRIEDIYLAAMREP